MAVETEVATVPELALADSDINRARSQGLLHPTAVVKTRMQAADSGLSHMLRNDGIPGLSRGFGTSASEAFPDGVLSLTAFEVSKDMMLKYTEGLDMPEATRVSIANGVAGMHLCGLEPNCYIRSDSKHESPISGRLWIIMALGDLLYSKQRRLSSRKMDGGASTEGLDLVS
ncbi:hypothetical protein H0E87_019311 [Populus deltoides]|uniref:Uncharacterized protein n=1 Tax=Populus deltoides TaxID=3696 RepID=A0A8T2XU16_POPDE|nr:hypothetical protein H0E87_019311 [Populus deltoides]